MDTKKARQTTVEPGTCPGSSKVVTANVSAGDAATTAPTHTRGTTTTSSRFQAAGQDQTTEMKGIVIDHSRRKDCSRKMNPDFLRKPTMQTLLKGLTAEEDFTIAFPDAEKWTDNRVVDVHNKKELYSRLWIEEQKKKMFDIMHDDGQLSSGITEKLKAKDDWTATEEQADTLKLLKCLKEICYRDNESSICPPVNVLIMKLKKFFTAFQDGSKDPTKYVKEIQIMWFEVTKAAGIQIVSEELIRYTMKQVFPTKKYGDYSGMSDADKKPIIKAAEQILLSELARSPERRVLPKEGRIDMLLQFKTAKNNNPKQTRINNPNNNNSKATRTEQGNDKQGSEKTYEGTAFVTNGEASKGVVKEAHQLLMNGIAEGETFGDELCFMQISNMELMTQGSYNDEDESLLSDDEVPMLVTRQTNRGSDSESSTTEVTSTGHYGSDNEWSVDGSTADWPAQSNSPQSQNRRGHEKPRSENCRSEDNRSEKPRSEDDASWTTDTTISPDTEFLLAQNHC
eukprot:jgi/Psemu1/21634/gm1.21634_g